MEVNEKILDTVIEDLKSSKAGGVNNQSETPAKLKKKRRVGDGLATKHSLSAKHKHIHHRTVTKEVSSSIMDNIKEESELTTDATENTAIEAAEPKLKINKILVRTPLVAMDNSLDRFDSDLTSEDLNINSDTIDKSKQMNGKSSPSKKGVNREISFSLQSERSSLLPRRQDSRKAKRPKSCRRFTKEHLELFLPRKSFFNSHDKILVEAGHQVDTHKERKKPNWRAILKMHTMEELYPVKKEEPTEEDNLFGPKDDDDESEDELFSIEKTETLVSKEGTKKRSKSSTKKAGNPEREEYKPLYEYMKYIHDNPDEYVALTKFTTKNLEYKHPNTLVRMGRIFRRGSNVRNSIYLHALHGLKASGQEPSSSQQEESEIVKLKAKAEAWLRGLTTQQYLKAKDLALKDMGEEDTSHSKWWLAFKTCQYLRVPRHVAGEGH